MKIICSVCGKPATKWDGDAAPNYMYDPDIQGLRKLPTQLRCDDHDPDNKWFHIIDEERKVLRSVADEVSK